MLKNNHKFKVGDKVLVEGWKGPVYGVIVEMEPTPIINPTGTRFHISVEGHIMKVMEGLLPDSDLAKALF